MVLMLWGETRRRLSHLHLTGVLEALVVRLFWRFEHGEVLLRCRQIVLTRENGLVLLWRVPSSWLVLLRHKPVAASVRQIWSVVVRENWQVMQILLHMWLRRHHLLNFSFLTDPVGGRW